MTLTTAPTPSTAARLMRELTDPPPETQRRIDRGIRTHRTRDFILRFVDSTGAPATGVAVEVEQIGHDFHFGANSFMLGGYDSAEKNARWEQAFAALFNLATVPFFWLDLEPNAGELRFSADSRPIFRRPPPDAVLDFCRRRQLTPKGHNLLWAKYMPDWVPLEHVAMRDAIRRRFEQIAERYAGRVPIWDVVNEVLQRKDGHMPADYVAWAYKLAAELFPQARLFVNEDTPTSWAPERAREYVRHIQALRDGGARVDGIGLQFHLFRALNELTDDYVRSVQPSAMLEVLDRYHATGLPVHVSEVTIPSAGRDDGDAMQAAIVRGLYRTWFSHPAVEAIIWWNPADGKAWKDEGRLLGGLLREDLSPKPAYEALQRLIHTEWTTRLPRRTLDQCEMRFTGFLGAYRITTTHAGRSIEHRLNLDRRSGHEHIVRL
jgi:endo-1,4-beta-xylanase